MEILFLTSDLCEIWNRFCLESDEAWFWHTTDFIEYTVNLRPELESRSKSFIIMDNKVPVAICPLILNSVYDGRDKYNIFSFDRSYSYSPALANGISAKQKQDILKVIFSCIDEMAIELKVKMFLLKISPLISSYFRENQLNYLMKFGFLNTSLNTQLIDLSLQENQLLKGITKGHRYCIRQASNLYEIKIYDKDSITRGIFEQYRLLHHKAAGRITRPLITFEMMYHWILQGKAILCGALYKEKYMSFALIITYKDAAFYGSASEDPDIEIPVPASHLVQWKVITWLKENSFRIYEIGFQQFNAQLYDMPSEKDINISLFKRGFGGLTTPVFSGEKFYSREVFLKTMNDRIEKFANYIPES